MISSFEIKARRAIERVALLQDFHDSAALMAIDDSSAGAAAASTTTTRHGRTRTPEERWKRAVQTVLAALTPQAKLDTSLDWAHSVRDELRRLQAESGLGRKAALHVLELRLDEIGSDCKRLVYHSNASSPVENSSSTSEGKKSRPSPSSLTTIAGTPSSNPEGHEPSSAKRHKHARKRSRDFAQFEQPGVQGERREPEDGQPL